MSFYTITLKLHKPSREKKKIMEMAMMNYTRAFDYLLKEAYDCSLDQLPISGQYELVKWIDKDLSARLNRFDAEPFKDALKIDFAMTFSSYMELKSKGKRVGRPRRYTDPDSNLKELRPIFFCRHDIKRDFCLLYDPDKRRYFVKLYLMNRKNARTRMAGSNTINGPVREGKLNYVHRSGLKAECGVLKERFILVPLSFGKWQEEYLKQCLDHPDMVKTARLVYRGGDYYITVNLDLPEKEKLETDTFLGISRGPENDVNLTITGQSGRIIESESVSLEECFGIDGKTPLPEFYCAVGRIVEKAVDNRSQVILENLKVCTDSAHEVDFGSGRNRSVLSKQHYRELEKVLNYKLELAGLSKPVKVSPFGIFSTCPKCGLNTKKSRSLKGMFLCISCGSAYHVRNLGSINLANKLIKYNQDDIKIKVVKEDEGIRLCNDILGVDLQVNDTEDYMIRLSGVLSDVVREAKESGRHSPGSRDMKKKWSLIKKIESFDDVMKHITFH